MKLIDKHNRVHDYLRISLTDRCNFNCVYCNPSSINSFAEKEYLLTFEEHLRLIEFFASTFEFKKFRFTGGEPLVRKGVFDFFDKLGALKSQYGFSTGLTTNGLLLKGKAKQLKNRNIDNLNISLDSLDQYQFNKITGLNELQKIIDVVDESLEAGFKSLKINMVVIKNINDTEILSFVNYFKNKNVNLRFIEFMPFGNNSWQQNGFISYSEIKNIIEKEYKLNNLKVEPNSVAKEFQLADYDAKISFISSISEHFCGSCNRVRVSSKGDFRLCLFSEGKHGLNFKTLFNEKYSDENISLLIQNAMNNKWAKHPDVAELVSLADNNMMTIGG